MRLVRQNDLPMSNIARELVGDDHGSDITILFVEAEPGRGPALHQHPYQEVFVIQAGEALFVAGDEEATLRAGDILVVPPNTPHRFTATGDGTLRQIDIHVAPRFATEWL
jgi:mannose-6-phosphate isomerase-like protein (cupin superfamily)